MRKTTTAHIATIGAALLLTTSIGVSAQSDTGGFAWEQLAPVSEEAEIQVHGLVELANGDLGAIGGGYPSGHDGYTAMSWGSSDGGQTWTEARLDMPSNGGPTIMVAHDGQFVAVGSRFHEDPSHTAWVWTSPDAVTWELATQIENAYVSDLQTTPEGLAMLGMDFRAADGFGDRLGGYSTLWLSEDGTEWEAQEISTPLYPADWEQPQYLGKLRGSDDGTWMASGRKAIGDWVDDGPPPFVSTAFVSDAEMAWSEIALPDEMNSGWVEQWTPAGFIFSLGNGGPGTEPVEMKSGLWRTTDGTDWSLAVQVGGMPVESSASDGTGMVAWRPVFDVTSGPPTLLEGSPMYVSVDGQTWEHPTPHLLEGVHISSASFMPDGRLLIAGNDVADCQAFAMDCAFGFAAEPGLWVGTPN